MGLSLNILLHAALVSALVFMSKRRLYSGWALYSSFVHHLCEVVCNDAMYETYDACMHTIPCVVPRRLEP